MNKAVINKPMKEQSKRDISSGNPPVSVILYPGIFVPALLSEKLYSSLSSRTDVAGITNHQPRLYDLDQIPVVAVFYEQNVSQIWAPDEKLYKSILIEDNQTADRIFDAMKEIKND